MGKFVSSDVVSGLGKDVTASSIGVLLKACGLRVTAIKACGLQFFLKLCGIQMFLGLIWEIFMFVIVFWEENAHFSYREMNMIMFFHRFAEFLIDYFNVSF